LGQRDSTVTALGIFAIHIAGNLANVLRQVLRYSALGAGIFYGLYHQAKLSTAAKLAAIDREYEHKQSLIEKARAEYAKKKNPASSKTEGGDGTFTAKSPFVQKTWRTNRSRSTMGPNRPSGASSRTTLMVRYSYKRSQRFAIRLGGLLEGCCGGKSIRIR
jgi:hypothetical protein